MDKKIFSGIIITLIIFCLAVPAVASKDTDSVGDMLCEYAMELYKHGNLQDALHQLNIALTVNPNNATARKYLKKIAPREDAPQADSLPQYAPQAPKDNLSGREAELQMLIREKEIQLARLSSQVDSFKAAMQAKDNELGRLQSKLQSEKGSIANENLELGLLVKEKQKEAEDKQEEIRRLNNQLDALRGQHAAELKQKDEDLNKARQDYENRLVALGGALQEKEALIKQLKDDKAAMLEKDKSERQQQLARVDGLMKEIEGIFPDKAALKGQPAASQGDINAQNRQLDRIDKLMKEIEEILPRTQP
jgi:peptidoglycan hydrolase CwlO-like protein